MAERGTLLVIGLGYSGRAIAAAAAASGFTTFGTERTGGTAPPPGVTVIAFDGADAALSRATHLVITAPPEPDPDRGDPALRRWGDRIRAAPRLRAIGYLSSTGVYGDRGGATVDETTEPAPSSPRAERRRAAELAWAALARPGSGGLAVDLVRLAGIYGPRRSVLDDLRAGRARPIRAPGHAFGRIHRDDIAEGMLAALDTADPARAPTRVLNFADDEPAESADVICEAARLLGVPPPPERTLEAAWPSMTPMARSFWSDNRRVRSDRTKALIGRRWRFPSFREGLRAVLAAEQTEQLVEQRPEQREIGVP